MLFRSEADEVGVEQDVEEDEQLNEFLPALAAAAGEMAGGELAASAGLDAMGTNIAKQAGGAIGQSLVSKDDDNDGGGFFSGLLGEKDVEETIDPTNPKDYEIPTYLRKQQGQAPLTPKDIQDKDEKAKRDYQKRLGVSEDTNEVLSRLRQLSGLAK